MGYLSKGVKLSASDLGADHIRDRFWVLAYADRDRELLRSVNAKAQMLHSASSGVWESDPRDSRVVNGMAFRMDRLKATGNGQVPAVAAEAFRFLIGEMCEAINE